jgi:MYXO-CTERM domain-containing protein
MRFLVFALLLFARTAGAEPRRVAVATPPEAFQSVGGTPSYLYLNRCAGGCTITGAATNDAAAHWTTIATPGAYTVGEFANAAGDVGTAADADWAGIVKCMQEVYSPFNIVVSDAVPPAGTLFNEAIIAGKPQNIGLGVDILGIAPFSNDCKSQANVISFSFANHHLAENRVVNICWTAAQESAHAFGLDHEYEFSDGNSACSDPMTYRNDCGGQKFFRNKRASCGEMAKRACKCNSTQNSHQQLLEIFGAGTVLTPAPEASIVYPANSAVVTPAFVTHVSASSQRGVAKVELYLNDSRWMVQPGAKFGLNGQPVSTYTFYTPANVPDGIIDIQAKAYDDLGIGIATIPITVTKGAPCANNDACADNQTCDAGRCKYPAPVGELGDSCEYGQFCKSWTCLGGDGDKFCTQDCLTDEPTSCPAEFECLAQSDTGTAGVCWPLDRGGCCSVSRDRNAVWIHGGFALLVLGLLRRRRR